MAIAVQLTNFTEGELSPRLDGRNDLNKYSSGCKTLESMIVYPHGSAQEDQHTICSGKVVQPKQD